MNKFKPLALANFVLGLPLALLSLLYLKNNLIYGLTHLDFGLLLPVLAALNIFSGYKLFSSPSSLQFKYAKLAIFSIIITVLLVIYSVYQFQHSSFLLP